MRLLLNKDLTPQKNTLHERAVLMISERTELYDAVFQQLAGTTKLDVLKADFLSGTVTLPANVRGMLIDIGTCTDVNTVISRVKSQVSQHCWCMLLGDADSISVAQGFLNRGVRYFHTGSQLAEAAQYVIAGHEQNAIKRRSVMVSVLGCKGGVGTSLLSWQLAQSIVRYRKLPLLLSQGNLGSQDLDILVGKKIEPGSIVSCQENIAVMLSDSVLPSDRSMPELQKYNFVLFDQALFNTSQEHMVQQAEAADSVLLVIDRSMGSIRTALNFIKIFERVSSGKMEDKRLFICLNDHNPVLAGLLSISDIQSLLGRSVNIHFPWLKAGGEAILEHKLWRGDQKPLETLTRMLLGLDDSREKSSAWRFLPSLTRRLN